MSLMQRIKEMLGFAAQPTRATKNIMHNLGIILLSFMLISCNKLTDTELKEQFYQNKNSINQLLKMQFEDSDVVRIAPGFTWVRGKPSYSSRSKEDIGFSEARWNEYRVLFREAGVHDGLVVIANPEKNFKQQDEYNILFLVSGYMGFAYTPATP